MDLHNKNRGGVGFNGLAGRGSKRGGSPFAGYVSILSYSIMEYASGTHTFGFNFDLSRLWHYLSASTPSILCDPEDRFFTSSDNIYHLVAVISHLGVDNAGGHFVTFRKCPPTGATEIHGSRLSFLNGLRWGVGPVETFQSEIVFSQL